MRIRFLDHTGRSLFNEAVRKMASDDALKPTKAAIDKAFAQVG